MSLWSKIFRRRRPADSVEVLRERLDRFRDLVEKNNQVLELIADAGEKLGGEYIFDVQYLRSLAHDLETATRAVVYDLDLITDNRYPHLQRANEQVVAVVKAQLESRSEVPPGPLVLPLDDVDVDLSDAVGAKMARLGALRQHLGCRVPDGFVVSAYACQRLLEHSGVSELLRRWSASPDAYGPGAMEDRARELRERLLGAGLPRELLRALRRARKGLRRRSGRGALAVRSSALGEDGDLSFAGQYESVLGVGDEDLAGAYLRVVASLFSIRAMRYRQAQGLPPGAGLMAVGCQRMVDARAAGVVYSLDPVDPERQNLVISAAWGLGVAVVDGSAAADRFDVSRQAPLQVVEQQVARKERMHTMASAGNEGDRPVPKDQVDAPALDADQLQHLTRTALRIERFMKCAQDIEWALDPEGELVILQARPLRISAERVHQPDDLPTAVRSHPILMEARGTVACRGIAAGRVLWVDGEDPGDDLATERVLVARTSSPRLAAALAVASAVITDVGTATGHLAAIAREYRVPAIIGTGDATKILREQDLVTVDAEENVVYAGRVDALIHHQLLRNSTFEDTPEFRLLRRMLRYIAPLHLSDPQSSEFQASNCTSSHDVIRFAHEKAVRHLTEGAWVRPSARSRFVRRLDWQVPLDLVLIDLGGGLEANEAQRTVAAEQVLSRPLRALFDGLGQEGVWATGPADMDLHGFMSSATRAHPLGLGAGWPEQNLAILSEEYLNLSLRLGYHFNIVDCYLTETLNDNYIYFRFAGGVTELARRSRRTALLKHILERYDFVVEGKGDLVIARIKKIDPDAMKERLVVIGRLIGFTRQLDIYLRDESLVERCAEGFLAGNNNPFSC